LGVVYWGIWTLLELEKGGFMTRLKIILKREFCRFFFLIFATSFFCVASSFASEFVHVKASEVGQGIIWKNGSRCYVIAPQHVVQRARDIKITNSRGVKFSAKRHKKLAEDAVLLKVSDEHSQNCETNSWSKGEGLDKLLNQYTIGVLKRRDSAGGVDQRRVDIINIDPTKFIKIRERQVDDIKKGWSGGALYINDKVAGMVIKVKDGKATVYRQDYLNGLIEINIVPDRLIPKNMVFIPGGEFKMGVDHYKAIAECNKTSHIPCQQSWYTEEGPEHQVKINPFYMDKYEVSQKEYENKMGENPSEFKSPRKPVENVSWKDANIFCGRLGKRLPTEAEWEKAARGKRNSFYPWGNEFKKGMANFCDKNCEESWRKTNYNDGFRNTAPVGSFPPNDYGLHNMAGNVWEWTEDLMDVDYYKKSSNDNPLSKKCKNKDTTKECRRVFRGGSWKGEPHEIRSTIRNSRVPERKMNYIGFRCAKDY
jgi:formylglycine-generating enzyme required for sulfatase activity